jgi:hypothetical protein
VRTLRHPKTNGPAEHTDNISECASVASVGSDGEDCEHFILDRVVVEGLILLDLRERRLLSRLIGL